MEVIPTSKQVIQKANNNTRQTQYQRASHKFPRRDNRAAKSQPFSTGCTSIQGCSQKAIAFSQGQMRDFQFVAAKLTKELKTMRQITKRCLLAESNTSNISDCNLDEVLLFSMKSIEILVFNVEIFTLSSRVNLFFLLDVSCQVKTLIGNAEKTEESSKKWLSIIERDCNRFCKLMVCFTLFTFTNTKL